MTTFYYGGDPGYNPYTGAPQANAANQAQYQAVLTAYKQQLAAQQLAMNRMSQGYTAGLGTIQKNIGTVDAGYGQAVGNLQGETGDLRSGYDAILNKITGVGQSQRTDLESQYARQLADSQQSMMDRGLYNTTVYDTAARGINSDMSRAQIALQDSLTREQADYAAQQQQALAQMYAQESALQQARYSTMNQGYQGYNNLLGQSLASQQQGYQGYQQVLGNQAAYMGSVQHQPIPNQVIPIQSGSGPSNPQQAAAQRAYNEANAYSASLQPGGNFGATGAMKSILGNAASTGTPWAGFLTGSNTGLGATSPMGGSIMPPSGQAGGYYVGGGGWGAPSGNYAAMAGLQMPRPGVY